MSNCHNRLNHIKDIALRVIAEDEFQPEPDEVIVPSEMEKPVEKPIETPKYVGQRTEIEELPSGGKKRTYEGGGVQVRVCPVCGYQNAIYAPQCENCKVLYSKMKSIVNKAKSASKTLDMDSKTHRLALWDNISRYVVGLRNPGVKGDPAGTKGLPEGVGIESKTTNYSPETLDAIWLSQGTTPLGPDTIIQVDPTNANKMQKATYDMNVIRDEHGDIVISPNTGMPQLKEDLNWMPLTYILQKLSVRGTGDQSDIIGMDEFYEKIKEYNRANPEKSIGHIDIGSAYDKIVSKEITPEFQQKTEVGSGGRALLQETVPDSKSAGFYSLWPWNDYVTPSGKQRSGVSAAFAERIRELPKLQLIAERNRLAEQLENAQEKVYYYKEQAQLEEQGIKENKSLRMLLSLRKTDLTELDEDPKTLARLEKTKNHLERLHGETLDERLEEISQYMEKQAKAIEKWEAVQKELQEKLVELANLTHSE